MCVLYRRCVGHNTQLFDYLLQAGDLRYIRKHTGTAFVVDMRKRLFKELDLTIGISLKLKNMIHLKDF